MVAVERKVTEVPPVGPGLIVEHLSRWFGRVAALEDVSLTVRPGELVALVGENGAGKSTLARCIAGDLLPDTGRVTIDGSVCGPSRPPAKGVSRHLAGMRRRGRVGDHTRERLAVVWQDLGLCADLDVVANIFLGRELGRGLLAEARMLDAAAAALDRLGARLPDLHAAVGTLSRGQQQEVALARALISAPSVLLLDEPTAALSVGRRTQVAAALHRLRAEQRAILLVTHDLDEAFALADRIIVLRRGRVIAVVSPSESHPDDVGALMSGMETESVARRQLDRLRSLVEQLSAAGPTASLPLVVSATALALDQDLLCLHLLAIDGPRPVLRRGAAVGLPPALLAAVETLPLDASGAAIGEAARRGALVICEDLEADPRWDPLRAAVEAGGVRSAWAAPIVGSRGVLGTVAGFARSPGRLSGDRIELLSLYAGHAAAAIEREQLFDVATRRNRVLESLRGMLESLAGPERAEGELGVALHALCRGLRAGAVGLVVTTHGDGPRWAAVGSVDASSSLRSAAVPADIPDRSSLLGPGLAGVRLRLPDGEAALVASFQDPEDLDADAHELLDDAARSLGLAIEREQVERAQREAAAAKRSHALQRQLLQRLSHELRTPLTAIHGYATTLQQPDLTWDDRSIDRFLGAIARESSRMERLVGDLLDSSAIESGLLRLRRDWTDLALVLEAARACVREPDRVVLTVAPGLEPIWADHDRLEQVFVNLLDNALRHGGPGRVEVVAARDGTGAIRVTVRDSGPGIRPELLPSLFAPGVRAEGSHGAGLGLAIIRGIAEAHGGTCSVHTEAPTTFEVTLPIEAPEREADDLPWEPADGRTAMRRVGHG